jgi:two-component system, response regulator YesN
MYKVLIIDDEEPVREAVKMLGQWDSLNITEIIEAQNGKQGLLLLEKYKPDIILVDMKMPEMNGIEFLKIVKEKYPEVCSIVISGFNDFFYTKEAIKSKAADYLLKPINREELNTALSKALDIIKENSRSLRASIENNIALNLSLPMVKEKILMSIIDECSSKENNDIYKRLVDLDGKDQYYSITLLKIMNLEEIKKKGFNNDIELLYYAISNVIEEITEKPVKNFSFRNPRLDREIIILSASNEANYLPGCEFLKKVVRKMKEVFGIAAIAAVGQVCNNTENLSEAYKSADKVIGSINLIGSDYVASIKDYKARIKEKVSMINKFSIIASAAQSGGYDYIKSIVEELIDEVKKSDYFSIRSANRILKELIIVMNDIAMELGLPNSNSSSEAYGVLDLREDRYDYSNLDTYKKALFSILDYSYIKIRDNKKYNENFNVYDIKEYIDRHYFEEIKISIFTDKYFLSREYLMKLFKQEFKFGIYEYVQKVRMEKAKELLKDFNVKINSISKMIGYSDNNYFSKAFRNYYGSSPSDYRAVLFIEKGHL